MAGTFEGGDDLGGGEEATGTAPAVKHRTSRGQGITGLGSFEGDL